MQRQWQAAGPAPLVLVVEDHPDTRDAVRSVLEDEGYRVETAGDGLDALVRLKQGLCPALILLDLRMPRMSGWEFRAEQQADPGLAGLPVVVFSADAQLDEKVQALHPAAVMRKPVDIEELLGTVERFAPARA